MRRKNLGKGEGGREKQGADEVWYKGKRLAAENAEGRR